MNVVVGILGKKAFGRLKDKGVNTNSDNPYTEKVPIHNNRGEIVKYKERERPIPEELSNNDKAILKKVRRKAYKWDMSFRCCCFQSRFGWSFLIGLIPVIGDFADLLMAMYLIKSAAKVDGGLPPTLYARMFWNVMVDFGIGLVPFLGDIVDALYRANTRNAWLLDAYLSEKAKALRTGEVEDESGHSIVLPGQLRVQTDARGRQLDAEMGMTQGVTPVHASRSQRQNRR
ncbi:hypothetical protein B0T25DRAFT_150428 [Lasiosphaeria hispida]|uniref:PH domain-containing protein n=1 Tax=Lasiosphaeria hispida TaxID=260671 RepID=A0AAJ0MFY3_9PEZI|nr:hypothetical protein B0T25DRAFT_150428 [Lasiosphaeria hispida]